MRSRLIVAVIGIPLVYLATLSEWQNNLAFALLVTLVVLLSMSELYVMTRRYRPFVAAGMLAGLVTPLLTWYAQEVGMLAGLVLTVPLTLLFSQISVEREELLPAIAVTLMGVAYVAVPGSVILLLRQTEHGFGLILLLLAGTWLTDTGAYIGGRAIGKHPLAPRLSPNKTIEGFLAGAAVGTFAVWFGHYLTGEPGDYWLPGAAAAWLGLSIAIAGTVGDLFESMLKRGVQVKDTSRLLGDHGGMLDRVDALLLTGPVLYAGAWLVGVL